MVDFEMLMLVRLFYNFQPGYHGSMNTMDYQPILFTGSSIIEYWETLREDMAPLAVVNRGMAGVGISKIRARIRDLVTETDPAVVVVYAGSNDLQGENPPKARYVLGQFEKIVNFSREILPDIPVVYLSIAPSLSPLRMPHQGLIDEANTFIAEFCCEGMDLSFCDIRPCLCNQQGRPDPRFFLSDGIHFSSKGYKAVAGPVRKLLETIQS